MTNKIVILDDSVILYEHYISDDQWEKTLAFPRGGLTYLVSNGTIKFYAYEDYFYRNCLISMQLPIYIVDEHMHIDGEYEDITELTEVLDRIFPTNDMDAQLEKYLKIVDAELLYQPIGDYALKSDIPDVSDFITDEDLVEALEDYYTKEESDARFQPKGDYATKDELDLKADKDDVYTKTESDSKYQSKGDYLTSADTYVKSEIDDKLDDKLDVSAYTPCDLSNYYTKQETSSKTQIDTALAIKADKNDIYTKTESDNKYQPKGNYQEKLIAGANITISGNVISASGGGGEPIDAYTKAESDARFQSKGNYATEQWVLNQKYITSSSTVFNNYYTTANTYNKTEINNYITQLQNQINSLQEALEECCSGTPTPTVEYRWVEMTSASDFVCSGYDKYAKEKKQQSTDGGTTWTDVSPAEYRQGSRLIESDSADCGYVPPTPEPMKWLATYSGGTTSSAECDSTSAITNNEIGDWQKTVSVEIGECVTTIGDLAFSGFLRLSGITIPNNVTSIGSQAFEQCIGLTTCSIGNGVTSIGTSAFGGCSGLTSINIPDSVTSLDQSAFHNCTSLTSVTIGSGCTTIGNTCFGNCGNISTFTCKATTPPALGGAAFGDTTITRIYVPASSVNAYKSANRWSDYSSIIEAIPS